MPRRHSFLDKSSRRGGARFAMAILAAAGAGLAGAARGQAVTEFPIPTARSQPFSIAAGPDGAIWFTEGIGKIGRITPAGAITEFPIPVPESEPVGITAGPDGNLWFLEDHNNKIGRITPAGVVTEFPIPTPDSFPFGIVAGPDGNLWFTYQSLPPPDVLRLIGRIGRITTAGVITEFSIPTTGSMPFGIAAGPDGNLWFAEAGAGKIGRITTAGVVTEFSIPTAGSPVGIAAGPDGNLWFTERVFVDGDLSVGKIGRITTAGVITEFPFPTAGNDPMGITAGPDGNLWFTEDFVNKIGRITTAGVITEATVPTPFSGPVGIAAGPDGNVWFTELFANKIGRVVPATCALSAVSLCLNHFRFAAEATWTASDGTSRLGQAVALTPDSGYIWFFTPDNPEIVVNTINGCSFNDKYWVFAGGLTNVSVVLRVTDTRTGNVKTYIGPPGTEFQPIQDTSAFACP